MEKGKGKDTRPRARVLFFPRAGWRLGQRAPSGGIRRAGRGSSEASLSTADIGTVTSHFLARAHDASLGGLVCRLLVLLDPLGAVN